MHEFFCDHVITYKITFDTHEELKKWKEEERNLGDMDIQWTEDKWEDGVIDFYDCKQIFHITKVTRYY